MTVTYYQPDLLFFYIFIIELLPPVYQCSDLTGAHLLYYRSDVLGQFMPLVGRDWSQTGVAHLFSAIKVGCVIFKFIANFFCSKIKSYFINCSYIYWLHLTIATTL